MQAILVFDLDNEDDIFSHKMALSGKDWAFAMQAYREHIRKIWKHGDLSDETQAVVDDLYKALFNVLEYRELSFDMIG